MNFKIENLIAERAKKLKPYSPIEPPFEIAGRLKLPLEQILKLDANENPYGCPPEISKKIGDYPYHHLYPDPAQKKIRGLLAKHTGFNPEQIAAGSGADEILDLICRLFLNPGDKILSFTPTFSYYSHLAQLNEAVLETVPRNENFEIDEKIPDAISFEQYKIVILCSPNNPTGNNLPEHQLRKILDKGVLTILDEAYADFSGGSFLELLPKYPNLILVKTFSKLFAMAGLRLGYMIAGENITDSIMRIKPPFSITTAAEAALEICVENSDFFQAQKEKIIATREKTYQALSKIAGIKPFPSQSNFILCRFEKRNALEIKDELERKGVLLRHFNTPRLQNFLRISIGTETQMQRFTEILQASLQRTAKKQSHVQ